MTPDAMKKMESVVDVFNQVGGGALSRVCASDQEVKAPSCQFISTEYTNLINCLSLAQLLGDTTARLPSLMPSLAGIFQTGNDWNHRAVSNSSTVAPYPGLSTGSYDGLSISSLPPISQSRLSVRRARARPASQQGRGRTRRLVHAITAHCVSCSGHVDACPRLPTTRRGISRSRAGGIKPLDTGEPPLAGVGVPASGSRRSSA